MKTIAYSIMVYFILAFIFKLLGDMGNKIWVNYYWIFSSAFYCLVFYKVSNLQDIKINCKEDVKKYKYAIKSISCYWGIMLMLRVVVAFKIELYDVLISSARSWTIGGVTIVMIYVLFILKTATKNDR